MTAYQELGLTPIINATGSVTRLGGAPMPQEVIDAFCQAAEACVPLEDLQAAASRRIAAATGTEAGLRKALAASEDSTKLNTAFIERLNLTIRAGSAYLARRALTYARWPEKLAAGLALVRCHYNFIRPHMALRFGRETRTPAMQAGLTTRRWSFRDVFMAARFT